MNLDECGLVKIPKSDFVAYGIWRKRFVDEYNRSKQLRVGHLLVETLSKEHWLKLFDDCDTPAYWIRHKNQTIGIVNLQTIMIGKDPHNLKKLTMVSDVYVAPKYRGKKILALSLLTLRIQNDVKSILIDGQKLIDHAGYYYRLGFKYSILWPEQELWIVSTEKEHDFNWTDMFPNIQKETV